MDRRGALAALLVLAAQRGAVHAQTRTATLALLWIDPEKPSPYLPPLLKGLREVGYAPGRNIRLDERFVVNHYAGLADAARKAVAENPDIILTFGATALLAAHKATKNLPIVMISGGDPVKLGVVKSLSRPQTNVTGIIAIAVDLSGKRLEVLKEAFPKIKRVAIALYPLSESEVATLKAYEAAAQRIGLETRAVEIRTVADIAAVIADLEKSDVDAIAFVGSTLFRANRAQLAAAVMKTRLPAIYGDDMFIEAGGLLSYGPNITEHFRLAASYIDKILKGAKPGELPVQQPTVLELVVNARTAKTQGIDIPRALLLRADRVIE